MSEQFYSSISKYYPQIFPLNPSQVRFLSNILPYNGARVLDVGCAAGDLAFALARFGFPIWGIDFDAEMIEMANQAKSEETIFPLFEQMDMRKINEHYPKAFFDTIICFGNTVVHLLSDEDINQFLDAVYRSLAPDGNFTLQLLNYNHILLNNIKSLPLIDNEHITFERNYEFTEASKLIDFNIWLIVKSMGQVIENSVKLNALRQEKLRRLLKAAGFKNIKYFGSFEGDPFQPNSLPLILTCNKK